MSTTTNKSQTGTAKWWGATIAIVACVFVALGTGCTKESELLDAKEVSLGFSTDTLRFDTVFTTIGSTTQMVKVYNHGKKDITISRAGLRGGQASRFRTNIDGDTSMVAEGIDIAAGDSCFVFVQVNVSPNSQTEPFLVEDCIDFVVECEDGVVRRTLVITAYGRNAVYHNPLPGRSYSVIDCENWNHDLPHVIIGQAVVDSAFTLTLVAGDELYFANDATLWVYNDGCLKVKGTEEKPVLFTSIRQDEWYKDLPGQWNTIWLSAGSHDNEIDWAYIENGRIGVVADTNVGLNPTLKLTNTVIMHESTAGIVAQGAWVDVENVLVADCGTAAVALQYGGKATFKKSTIANYWRYSSRRVPSLVLNNWYRSTEGETIMRDLTSVRFEDCIVYGNYATTEVLTDKEEGAEFNVSFARCDIKGLAAIENVETENCMDENPMFEDIENFDFRLKEDSPAIGLGYDFGNGQTK